ncbi:MAG: NAD/FAD-binding protein [Limnohabitans sp.]|nr:NAD/FAD-binding protein [Limnohabitans sp.]
MRPRVAIVGSGIAGLSAAHGLNPHVQASLFESAHYFGGHAHTVDVTLLSAKGPITHGVDTGFLVYNERTYPGLIDLFERLNIQIAHSDMSFSAQAPLPNGHVLEWNGATLNTVFAQRSNLFHPRFWNMLSDVLRFNRLATELARNNRDHELMQPLQIFLDAHDFSSEFCDWYLLPMLGCIWSCPTDQMLQFPVATKVRFFDNHGLIQVNNRPQWFTVQGGSRYYVEKIIASIQDKRLKTPVLHIHRDAQGVLIQTTNGTEHFDHVVLACHADQALALLNAPSFDEQRLLGAIRFQSNRAVLHTDTSQMPRHRLAWAAWNYERKAATSDASAVCLHYWINKLQPLPFQQDVIVSLNPIRYIDPSQVIESYDYDHPVLDLKAIQAQQQLHHLQGTNKTYWAGAWMGYGFHEDGFQSGLAAAQSLLNTIKHNVAA